jgi:hypothetical protein
MMPEVVTSRTMIDEKSSLHLLMDRSHDITTHPLTQRDPSHHCTIVLTFLRLRILFNGVEA